jgi:hypothetical protein
MSRRGSVFSWTLDGLRKFMLVTPLRMSSLLCELSAH